MLVGFLGSQVGLSSALVGLASGVVGSLGSQMMLPHGLVRSQRSQLIVSFLESSGLVGLSSRLEVKCYGPKIKYWMCL